MAEASTTIALEHHAGVATLRLTPPEGKPPTLDHAVLDALDDAIAQVQAMSPRVVVVASAAAKYFCVGANIAMLKDINENTIGRWIDHGHQVLNRLEDLPCPVIARVEGFALGGGLELALAADILFASDTAKLGLTEASLGFIPGWGGCRRLADRIGAGRAKHAFFASRVIGAGEALRIGLVDVVVTAAELNAELAAYCEQVAKGNANAITTFKKLVNARGASERGTNASAEGAHSVDCVRDPDAAARLRAFLDRKG